MISLCLGSLQWTMGCFQAQNLRSRVFRYRAVEPKRDMAGSVRSKGALRSRVAGGPPRDAPLQVVLAAPSDPTSAEAAPIINRKSQVAEWDPYIQGFAIPVPGSPILIRPIDDAECKAAATIQAEAFNEDHGSPMLGMFGLKMFEAEVLAALRQKLKYNPPDRFTCLVAVHRDTGEVMGVVECSRQNDSFILQNTIVKNEDGSPRTDYAYLACMAVLESHRRKGIARALLKAGEALAVFYGYSDVYLNVHTNNIAARTLYASEGYSMLDEGSEGFFKPQRKILLGKTLL